ncbi:MAG: hypothetical protein K2H53_05690 [Clostridia bacterium]|nr:hypothetical protein [Clostridia bacterium]
MWPTVDVKEGKISGMDFVVMQQNEEECKDSNTIIKEIVMIYAKYEEVSYDKNKVPLVVQYYTEFGMHIILFSKVKKLQYENRGIAWTATYTSDKDKTDLEKPVLDDGEYVPEEKLTRMFFNMLKEAYTQPSEEECEEVERMIERAIEREEELRSKPCSSCN